MDPAIDIPVPDNNARSIDVVRGDDKVFHQIVPSQSEAKGGIDEACRITAEARIVAIRVNCYTHTREERDLFFMRKVGRHFSQARHDHIAYKSGRQTE